jgi:hypothetical protein
MHARTTVQSVKWRTSSRWASGLVPNSGTTKIRGDSDDLAKIRGSNSWSAVSSTADVVRVGVQELKLSSSLDTVGQSKMHNPVEIFGLVASLACVVLGALLLYDGINSQFQVIGGATLLSGGLVVTLLITKSRWQRTIWRYRRHLH